uniref:Beta-lactamase-related domain-containing protein n=1 Tax=Pseudictyota dubia TaxID=2749911 RepID=A0A7R9ZCG7_9STRA|mmetsp:Transcript_40339/g.74656  ORF Transcript_40339/g.74656 Transcript_40339/m.74656 type:complete len:440 (+) Transcript_40339:452-1771(+)
MKSNKRSSPANIVFHLLVVAAMKNGQLVQADSVTATNGAPIDLSKELEEAASLNASPGAKKVNDWAASDPFVRTMTVLEHGKIVSSYVRDDVDPEVPWQAWSTTKSWVSLLTGVMLQDGSLSSLNETLGDIFPEEESWAEATDTEFRKAVTVRELLTMSSGLVPEPWDLNNTEADMAEALPGGDSGGGSLPDALAFPLIGEKGKFSYLGISNIMSYVILERTGMTPRQYLAENVLPDLGIDDSDINWWQNADGVEYAYHGIELTPEQMAKFGQLYLAEGATGPGKPSLLPAEWFKASTSAQLEFSVEIFPGFTMEASYGYLFWSGEGEKFFRNPNIGKNTVWCAFGAGGQDICIDKQLGRVNVMQRDFDPTNMMANGLGAAVAMDPTLSFEVDDKVDEDDVGVKDSSGDTTSASACRRNILYPFFSSTTLSLFAFLVGW